MFAIVAEKIRNFTMITANTSIAIVVYKINIK
jgi:hypothetical protein